MAFEPIGSIADRVIGNLARLIEEQQRSAEAVADQIGGPDHTKHLGAQYETHAEAAQALAREQLAWERLQQMGWFRDGY